MSDLPYRSPISISHIDIPIISCHSAWPWVRADLPGMKKEDVTLEVDGNVIRIGRDHQLSPATSSNNPIIPHFL